MIALKAENYKGETVLPTAAADEVFDASGVKLECHYSWRVINIFITFFWAMVTILGFVQRLF